MNANQVFYFVLLLANAVTAYLTSIDLLRFVSLSFVAFCGAMISLERDVDNS